MPPASNRHPFARIKGEQNTVPLPQAETAKVVQGPGKEMFLRGLVLFFMGGGVVVLNQSGSGLGQVASSFARLLLGFLFQALSQYTHTHRRGERERGKRVDSTSFVRTRGVFVFKKSSFFPFSFHFRRRFATRYATKTTRGREVRLWRGVGWGGEVNVDTRRVRALTWACLPVRAAARTAAAPPSPAAQGSCLPATSTRQPTHPSADQACCRSGRQHRSAWRS